MIKKRNSSIELLRILSMFLIVIHHYAVHGTLPCYSSFNPSISASLRINLFLHVLGRLGVVIFVMIGAYFLCEKTFNFKRPVNLALNTMLYSFGIYFILKYFFHYGIPKSYTWKDLWFPFPLPSGYWFVSSYILMLFFMPMFNLVIKNFNRKQLLLLIEGLFVVWSLLPTAMQFFKSKPDIAINDFGYTTFSAFTLAYFMSAYVKKYKGKFLSNPYKSGCSALVILLVFILLSVLSTNSKLYFSIQLFYVSYNPLIMIEALLIFSFFKEKYFVNYFVNYFAQSMFGVYLIHENSFLRPIIWEKLISSNKYAHYPWLYLGNSLLYSLLVFIICIFLDIIIRRLLFSRLINYLTLKISNLFQNLVIHYLNDDNVNGSLKM